MSSLIQVSSTWIWWIQEKFLSTKLNEQHCGVHKARHEMWIWRHQKPKSGAKKPCYEVVWLHFLEETLLLKRLQKILMVDVLNLNMISRETFVQIQHTIWTALRCSQGYAWNVNLEISEVDCKTLELPRVGIAPLVRRQDQIIDLNLNFWTSMIDRVILSQFSFQFDIVWQQIKH